MKYRTGAHRSQRPGRAQVASCWSESYWESLIKHAKKNKSYWESQIKHARKNKSHHGYHRSTGRKTARIRQ